MISVSTTCYIKNKYTFYQGIKNWYKMRLRQELAEWINFKWDGLQTANTCIVKICRQSTSSTSITSLAAFSSDLLLSQIHRNPFLCLWKVGIKMIQPRNHGKKSAMGWFQESSACTQSSSTTSLDISGHGSRFIQPQSLVEGCLAAWHSEPFSSHPKLLL